MIISIISVHSLVTPKIVEAAVKHNATSILIEDDRSGAGGWRFTIEGVEDVKALTLELAPIV